MGGTEGPSQPIGGPEMKTRENLKVDGSGEIKIENEITNRTTNNINKNTIAASRFLSKMYDTPISTFNATKRVIDRNY